MTAGEGGEGGDPPPRIRTANSGNLAARMAEEASEGEAEGAPVGERASGCGSGGDGEPWWQPGLRFECSACGKCCTTHGADGEFAYVYSTRAERKALAAHLGLSLRAFERRYLETHAAGVRSFKSVDDACCFLDERGQCSVYELRPSQCRTFPFWSDLLASRDTWERDVASFCPGVGEGPLHDAEAIARRMAEPDAD